MIQALQPRIDEGTIAKILTDSRSVDTGQVREILAKARLLKGLTATEVGVLSRIEDPVLLEEMFMAARQAKDEIYGRRLVLFTPLYVSNLCANDCSYCAFRASNRGVVRKALSQTELAAETASLIDEGHKRVLLVAGEAYPREGFDYILKSIETIYGVQRGEAAIRRINVNVAPLAVEQFKQLRTANIGTYQIFQETYHRQTYGQVHLRGRKADFDWRLAAMDRAFAAGIDDVGVGVLFGLADWRFELQALMQHIAHLEQNFGVGPHTISVPRLEPATGASLAANPPHAVSDADFHKIVAILRLAVPYTGIIMSTRETAATRRETLALGVSQISAGSRTSPGAYADAGQAAEPQFSLGDHRSLDDVVRDVAREGYVPSFCTGCYRLGRTGADFMDLARPGDIKRHCDPNGLSSFLEYLLDYAAPATVTVGEKCIAQAVARMSGEPRYRATTMLDVVRRGRRDVYC